MTHEDSCVEWSRIIKDKNIKLQQSEAKLEAARKVIELFRIASVYTDTNEQANKLFEALETFKFLDK